VEEIVNESQRTIADLIVFDSPSKSALKEDMHGSVTYGVGHKDTNISVLIARR
jgi:hypothetical protein